MCFSLTLLVSPIPHHVTKAANHHLQWITLLSSADEVM